MRIEKIIKCTVTVIPLVGGNDDGGVALELIGAADCNGGVCVVHDNAGQWGEAA